MRSSASASKGPNARTFSAEGVKTIFIRTEAGAMTLDVAAGDLITTDVSPEAAPGGGCAVTEELRDGTLTLAAVHGAAGSCSAGIAASAPAGVDIIARSDSGSAEFGAFSGKIAVRTDSGPIILHGPSGALILRTSSGSVTGRVGGQNVDIQTESGNVFLRGLTGSVKARSGSGVVALEWTGAPQIGDIDVRTDGGDFLAALPMEARLKFSLKSGSGKVRSDFSSDASAALNLNFRSDSGYATLKKRSAVERMNEDFGPTQVFDRAGLLRW